MSDTALLPQFDLSAPTREGHAAVVAHRHALHRIPEVGLELPQTAAYIRAELDHLGVPYVNPIAHGVAGLIESPAPGPTVMLRADADALPVTEETTHEYVSIHAGAMHACGHDTHMAMLLGLASRVKGEGLKRGRLKLVFQPGEEGHAGALAMIAGGVLEHPKVDVAYGQHIWAEVPTGTILIEAGPVMAAVDRVHIRIHGKGTHAAYPQGGHDPIYCGAQIVTALQSIITRNVDPLQPAVITVAMFHAGTAHNIIPPLAELTCTVRVFDAAAHALIERRIHEVAGGVASALGCRADIEYIHEHSPVVNSPEVAAIIREEAVAIVGAANVIPHQKTMGAEDFSDFLKQVPGAFVFVGGRNEAKDCVYPHHHPRFNIDEDALAIGSELMYRVAQRLLQG